MRNIIQNLLDSSSDEELEGYLVGVGAKELQALRDLASNKYTLIKMEKSFCPTCGAAVSLLAEDRLEIAFFICDCGQVAQVGVAPIHQPMRWDSDVLQFARLISEMGSIGIPGSSPEWEALRGNMDLSKEELDSLFERAVQRWDTAKAAAS